MKPGNAGGAKGCRFGITGRGNMARHSAEKAMATRLARFTRRGQAPVDDLNWEPDGVTLHVRFCEGPGTTEGMVEIMWHRRETRRKPRRQSSTYSHPENPVYSPMLTDGPPRAMITHAKKHVPMPRGPGTMLVLIHPDLALSILKALLYRPTHDGCFAELRQGGVLRSV